MSLFSMDWIRLRCREDEDTGCLLWRQAVNHSGSPVAAKVLTDGKKTTVQLRRQVWEHRHGPVPEGMLVTFSCKHARCLHHLELVTKAEVIRRKWTKTDARAKQIAGMTKAGRERSALDMEKAREIRNSDETLKKIAARLGISVSLASLVRRGVRWKEPANPFAGLGAQR